MANGSVSVHAGIHGMGIYAIMLPPSGFSVAHWNKLGSPTCHIHEDWLVYQHKSSGKKFLNYFFFSFSD